MRLAKDKEFKLVIAYAKQNNGGGHTGGTLFLISMRHATLIQSTEHDAGALEVQLDFGGARHHLLNCYTPVSTMPRIDFYNKIKTKLHDKMIGMGDWNCVPDVTLDVQSANPLKYPNGGAKLLEHSMAAVGLVDIRRIQLGSETEGTRTDKTTGTTTRIDRFYVPTHDDYDSVQWTIVRGSELVWKDTPSDHIPIILTVENTEGELGKERETIREDLCDQVEIQEKIIQILRDTYAGNNRSNARNWTTANDKIVKLLLEETKKQKKKEKVLVKQQIALVKLMTRKLKTITPATTTAAAATLTRAFQEQQKKMYALQNPEAKALFSTGQSLACFNRSDECTQAMFKPFKAIAKQNWVNKLKNKRGKKRCW